MQKTDNRSNGGRFEQEMSALLADHGFWVHVLQQNKAGQPADIIAIRGRFHTLIDCKVISDDKGFSFDRVEENQKYAMRMFHRKCCDPCYFALRLPDGEIRILSLDRIETMRGRCKKRLTDYELRNETWTLEKWLDASETWAEET